MLQAVFTLAAVAAALAPPPSSSLAREDARIRSHLVLVESLLRAHAFDGDSAEQRTRGLDALHAYIQRGVFPRNHERPGRAPVFIDDDGVACAVAYIMIDSGHGELAEEIRATQNGRWLDEMAAPSLSAWVGSSGFTLDELRLIQPSYDYSRRYLYAAFEAAYLCDQKTFFEELAKAGIRRHSSEEKSKLNAALRIVAPVANWDKEKAAQDAAGGGRNRGVSYDPPPRRANGIPFVRELLKRGADPNDTQVDADEPRKRLELKTRDFRAVAGGSESPTHPLSAVFLTKDPEVRALLVKAGGKLTLDDQLIEAVSAQDRTAVQRLLASSNASSTRPGHAVLCGAYGSTSVIEAYGPLASNKDPRFAILNDLMASSLFNLNESCPYDVEKHAMANPDVAVAMLAHGFAPSTQASFDALARAFVDLFSREPRYATTDATRAALRAALLEHKSLASTSSAFSRWSLTSTQHPLELAALYRDLESNPRRAPPSSPASSGSDVVDRTLAGFLNDLGRGNASGGLTPEQRSIVRALVETGADIDQYYGETTPTSFAITNDDASMLLYLLDHGARATGLADDASRCPPLAMAIERGDPVLVRLLLLYGADPRARYNEGRGKCIDPQRAGGRNAVWSTISQMPASPEIRRELSVAKSELKMSSIAALHIKPFEGAPDSPWLPPPYAEPTEPPPPTPEPPPVAKFPGSTSTSMSCHGCTSAGDVPMATLALAALVAARRRRPSELPHRRNTSIP